MVDDLPSGFGAAPDRRTPGQPRALRKRVGEQIEIRRELAAVEARGFQVFFWSTVLVAAFQLGEHEFPAVAASRGADLPEGFVGHPLEVGAGRAVLGPVEDGLASSQLAQHGNETRLSFEIWFHSGPEMSWVEPGPEDRRMFDMSGGRKQAKLAGGRPLDGVVSSHGGSALNGAPKS